MKNIKYIILIVFTTVAISAKCQTPGYLGKTFDLSYSYQFFQSLINMDQGEFPLFGINNFRLEKTIDRNWSMVISYDMFSPIVVMDENIQFASKIPDQYGDMQYYDINDQDKVFTVNSQMFGLHFRKYTKGWLSPIGSYFSFGLYHITTTSEDYLSHTPLADSKNLDTKFQRYYVSYSYGQKWMMNDWLSLHLGANMALSFSADLFGDYYGDDAEQYYQIAVKKRIRKMLLFNLEFGVGVLLF